MSGVGRFVLTIILFTAIGVLAGIALWIALSTVYKSSATVEISTKEFKTEGVAETKESVMDVAYKSRAVIASFESFLLASRAANRLGRRSPEDVRNRITAKSPHAALVVVSAKAESPQEAHRVLQAVLDERLALERENFSLVMKPLIRGIDSQLEELRRDIGALYQQLATYAAGKPDAEEKNISGSGRTTIEATMAQLTAETEEAGMRLSKLSAAIVEIEKGGPGLEAVQDFGEASYSFADLKRQLAGQAVVLASLRTRYGDKNSKVEAAKAELDETKRLLVQGLRELAHQAEARHTALVATRKSLEERLQMLKSQTAAILDHDAVYNSLVSSKDSLELVYRQLLARKNELTVTSQMQPVTLQMLDVPDLPQRPYIIIKLLLFAGCVGFGVFVGICVAILRSGVSMSSVLTQARSAGFYDRETAL